MQDRTCKTQEAEEINKGLLLVLECKKQEYPKLKRWMRLNEDEFINYNIRIKIIEDEVFAKSHEMIFDRLWEIAKP